MIIKVRLKVKHRSHWYEINRPSSRYGCKYTSKYMPKSVSV